MRLRSTFLALLVSLTPHTKASENTYTDSAATGELLATAKDLDAIKGLIKKESYLQARSLQNQATTLDQLKSQINKLDTSLETSGSQQSLGLSLLYLIEGLLIAVLAMQVFGIWQIRKFRNRIIQTVSLKIEIATNNIKSTLEKLISAESLEKSSGSIASAPTIEERSLDIVKASNLEASQDQRVFISKIEVKKAVPFFEEDARPGGEIKSNQDISNPDISNLLSEAKKIKTQELERIHNQRPGQPPPPRTRSLTQVQLQKAIRSLERGY